METLTMKPCLLATLLLPGAALAQSATPAPATMEAKIAALEAAAKASQSAGDNAWMLTSAALVDSAADLHGLSIDVRDHHRGADHRGICGADEVQRHVAVHGAVGLDRLLPHGSYGVR